MSCKYWWDILQFLVTRIIRMIRAKNYEKLSKFVKVFGILRWNIQQWAWPVTAGVLWFCSVRWCRDSEVLETYGMNQPTAWLVVRMAASSNWQWCAVRRSTCSSRFEEWQEWMWVGHTTWFDDSSDVVDQLQLETGRWRLCRMLLSDYFFDELTEVTIEADWEP